MSKDSSVIRVMQISIRTEKYQRQNRPTGQNSTENLPAVPPSTINLAEHIPLEVGNTWRYNGYVWGIFNWDSLGVDSIQRIDKTKLER